MLKYSEGKIRGLQAIDYALLDPLSLDTPSDNSGETLRELLVSTEPSPEEQVYTRTLPERLQPYIEFLSPWKRCDCLLLLW